MASPPPPPPAPALGSRLFRIRRTFSLDPQSRIAAVAAHSLERRQLLALAVSTSSAARDDPHAHYLLVRSVEEDRRVRHWRFPLAASHAKQQQQRVEPVAALAFSPEGDWLACLSTRKQRLHLVPVATLLASHRRAQLARSYQPRHNREWMSVAPSVMTAPMASYLRATNEAGGLNGARYHSRVAGDDAQMSTLEFAVGMGDVTCCRWWRSMNGRDYCLVGGSDNMISIVNVQDNAEECRCELQHAGAIESIELLYESFRKEKRTSMLVKTRAREAAAPAGEPARPETVKYYRVVLEKKTFVAPKEAAGGDSQRSLHSSASETVVIKTFPEHFVEDLDFRPQRIKKTKPDVRLRAINGLLSTESELALYDAAHHQISVYGNFQWKLKGQYTVPLASDIADVDIAYCSPDLLLLQGTRAGSGEPVATWLSLPSRQLGLGVEPDAPPSADDAPAAAHVVHSLSLHDNERVESVLQTTASPPPSHGVASASGEVIYVLQTAHHVYECRPQWSRLALFRALRAQEISLRDALSIGYALGIDMASLCEVVADTVCSELLPRERGGPTNDDDERVEETRQWVHDLYDVSRAAPSKAVEQLTRVGGAALAIAYAKRTLAKEPPVEDASERHRVALLVVELIFQQQAQHSFHDATSATSISTTTLRPRETETQSLLEENDAWLHALLAGEHQAFATDEMIELCLSHHQIDKAVAVAIARDAVPLLLQRIVARGLAPMLALPSGTSAVACLLDKGFAHELLAPAHRVVLRSLPTATQLDVALATQSLPRILSHRDWIVRNLPGFTKATCVRLATLLEPSVRPHTDADDAVQTPTPTVDLLSQSDVASSEAMAVTSAERVELFLTLLLRINRPENDDVEDAADASGGFSQQALESYLRTLASQYRPPIMITRCVDYGNWHAAASLHEAHGELVDAVECRLQSHQRVIQQLKSGRRPAQRRASKHSLVEEDEETEDPPEDNEAEDEDDEEPEDALASIRSELLRMVDVLVVHPPTPADALRLPPSSSSSSSSPSSTSIGTISDTIRAAILARLLVKWFEYGLSRADLELHLIDPTVFPHVASPLARIFFRDVIDRVGGKGLHPSKRLGAQDDDRDKGFDERDKAWVRRCHALPFAGQFLFHVCLWLLEQPHHASTDSNTIISSSSPSRLLEVARENIEKNDLSVRAVRIEPHAAPLIGKSDPLETHVKAFTCGHFFPKRVFDEDLVPEFERRMLALPTPLFATRQLLLTEFKRSHVEAPCPVCAFNKISATVFAQQQQSRPRETKSEPPSVYFLHGHQSVAPSPALPSPFGQASPSSASVAAQWAHDEWEWRGTATA